MSVRSILLFAISLSVSCVQTLMGQQVPDETFKPEIKSPAFESDKGPRIGIDSAHHNFHTATGRYQSFAKLLKRDGYQIVDFDTSFSEESLKTIDVLVISNPLNKRNVSDWSLPTPSAFKKEEISAVKSWVANGGSLFLIADHMPFPGAASDLAKAFGFTFSNGYAKPAQRKTRGTFGDVFDQKTGLIDSKITSGRSDSEKVTSVATFGGSAFKAPEGAIGIIQFGPKSVSRETRRAPGITPDAPTISIAGWYQGAALNFKKGRVIVFGEAAMFSAQLAGAKKRAMGMNAPNAKQNYQLLLNVIHWLTKVDVIAE